MGDMQAAVKGFIPSVMGSWRTFFPTRIPFDYFPLHEGHTLKNPITKDVFSKQNVQPQMILGV